MSSVVNKSIPMQEYKNFDGKPANYVSCLAQFLEVIHTKLLDYIDAFFPQVCRYLDTFQ